MIKRKTISIILILLMILHFVPINVVQAISSDGNLLISVGTGKYAITVTTTTTLDDIKEVLGEPKIATDSAFGGKAYTFYTDSNYSNYLYIETTDENKIISFGSVDPTYKTKTYSYGDKYNYRENAALYGCLLNINSVVKGGIYYNREALIDGSVSETINLFKNNYGDKLGISSSYYLREISKQAITMYNAIAKTLDKNAKDIEFNEDFFYINEQMKESGSTIKDYLSLNDKSSYMKVIGSMHENIEISNSVYYILNPLMFASCAKDNKGLDLGEKTTAIIDYNVEKKQYYTITVSKDIFEDRNVVDMTSEEIQKLNAGREEYENAISKFKEEKGLYDIEPQSTEPTTLVAGQLKQSKKEGITSYLNAMRVSGGLPKLRISEDAFNVAQHMSTLQSYRFTQLNLPIKHVPEKPTGVTDEYYNTAVLHSTRI